MSATNELDAVLSHESIPDEFCRAASVLSPRERGSVAFVLSGIVRTRQQDGVMCPLMLRRHLVVPAWRSGANGEADRRV